MLGTRGFEEFPVMLDGARRFVCLIVQLAKIVVRGGASRRNRQHAQQCFLGDVELPPGTLGEREIHERIPGSRLEIIPGGSHLCFAEHPEVYMPMLREFLAAHE